jgi:hypothetical protein
MGKRCDDKVLLTLGLQKPLPKERNCRYGKVEKETNCIA